MAKVERFEDLKVWQVSRLLAIEVFELSKNEKLAKDYSIKDQMNRSAGSIMDNIAEGFERGGKKEFIHFLYIAKGSAGELRSQIYRAKDRGFIETVDFEKLLKKVEEASKQLMGFIQYLKNTEYKGNKYVQESELAYENSNNFEL
jgi:four helix bundle protein